METKKFDRKFEIILNNGLNKKKINRNIFDPMNFKIVKEQYYFLGIRTTVCLLTLRNKMEVIGVFNKVNEKKDYLKSKAKENAIKSLENIIKKEKEKFEGEN